MSKENKNLVQFTKEQVLDPRYIFDPDIREYVMEHCDITEDSYGSKTVVSKNNGSYITLLSLCTCKYPVNEGLIKLLAKHKIYELYSYTDYGRCPSTVANHGFSEAEQKWYGWSHRGFYGFGIGYEVHNGDITHCCGFLESHRKEHPELDFSLPVGFKAKTLDDCKRMAIAYSESIS